MFGTPLAKSYLREPTRAASLVELKNKAATVLPKGFGAQFRIFGWYSYYLLANTFIKTPAIIEHLQSLPVSLAFPLPYLPVANSRWMDPW